MFVGCSLKRLCNPTIIRMSVAGFLALENRPPEDALPKGGGGVREEPAQ